MAKDCIIHQGVTLGRAFGGKKAGCPSLGDNVICFPGAKIIGKVYVGKNVIIGANAVVSNDIPDNCVVVGVPAKIVSKDSLNVLNNSYLHYLGWL